MNNKKTPISKRITKLIPLLTIAASCMTATTGLAQDSMLDRIQVSKNIHLHCPPISMLTKTPKQTWKSDGGWRSYRASFTDKITTFLGAQWSGVSIGQVSCLYRGDAQTDFPVTLYYNKQILQPTDKIWTKNRNVTQNSYNCITHQIKKCQFSPLLNQKKEDPYKIAEQLKSKKTGSDRPLENL